MVWQFNIREFIRVGFFAALICLAGCSVSITDSANMLTNLSNSYPGIWKLITSGAYLMGMALIMRAIYYLKIYGESRSMMSSQSSLKVPLTYLVVAAVFMYLPSAFHSILLTMFGTTEVTPISYNTEGLGNLNVQATNAVFGFIQIVGLISFVRGWLIIVKSAQGSAQGATVGKGVTHIIGGILAINIVGTRDAIWATLGLS
jgi:intracellular multiplication protein IcmC